MKFIMQRWHFNKTQLILFLIVLLAALLRFGFLDKYPVALYSDEVSQGYNAFSILRTGRDEYGKLFPITLRSFGDWKPPLTTYLMIPAIWLFGLNAWGVRLPSAFSGTATIYLSYWLVLEIMRLYQLKTSSYKENTQKIALLTAFFMAVSPWHILLSRSAMLVVHGLFLWVLALWAFIRGLTSRKYWYLSSASFGVGIYAYYGMRLVVPLFVLGLFWLFYTRVLSQYKTTIAAACVGLTLLVPLMIGFWDNRDVIFGRARTVSIFYDQGVVLTVWDLIAQDGANMPRAQAQFFHNKPYHYLIDIIRRFFQHFDGRFLFFEGDKHPPFQIPGMGVLYLVDGFLITIGLWMAVRRRAGFVPLIILWSVCAVLPAALTFVTPSANRTFNLVFPTAFLSAYGVYYLLSVFPKRQAAYGLAVVYALSVSYFVYQYIIVLPLKHADWWHFGYKELFNYLEEVKGNYETIVISGKASVPYVFHLFYGRVEPGVVKDLISRNYKDDEFGFEHVDTFGKFEFRRYFSWENDRDTLAPGTLVVLTGDEQGGDNSRKIKEIAYPDNRTAFVIYAID